MLTDSRYILLPLLVCILLTSGCQERVDDQNIRLEKIIHEKATNERLKDLRAIFVLAEDGCPACSKAFSGILEKHLEDPSCLFWVTAMGTGLDISAYHSSGKRVIWDYDDYLGSSGILVGSGAIVLKDGKIDTVVPIGNARTVVGSLNYLSDLLQPQRSDSLSRGLAQ